MHQYMTRHMVALQPMTYGDMSYGVGDVFLATPVDEPYLQRAGRARPVDLAELQQPAQVPPAPAPVLEPPAPPAPPAELPAPVAAAEPQRQAAEPDPPAAEEVSQPARRPYTRRNSGRSDS